MVIPGFSRYDISRDGIVTNLSTGRELKWHKVTLSGRYKYLSVALVGDDGKYHVCYLLRLLALTYLGEPEQPSVARSKDGDNLHIHVDNVEWVPYSRRTREAWGMGAFDGRKPKRRCYTEEMIDDVFMYIKAANGEAVSPTEVSDSLNISYSQARYSLYALLDRGKVIAVKSLTGRTTGYKV